MLAVDILGGISPDECVLVNNARENELRTNIARSKCVLILGLKRLIMS